jgi:anti-sigma-K factor RskA
VNEQEFAELSAGHALGALSSSDERRFADALATHPEWQSIVDSDAGTGALLADAVAEVSPPADIRRALLAGIAGEPAAPPADGSRSAPAASAPPARSRMRRTWMALAASVVLVVALGVSGLIVSQQLGRPPAQITLAQIEQQSDAQSASAEVAGGGRATAHWSETLGKSVLVSDGLPAIATDQQFELWYVRDGAAKSAGTFSASGGETTAVLKGAMQPGDTIAVTVEQSGGSPSGQPTTDPILAIPTA